MDLNDLQTKLTSIFRDLDGTNLCIVRNKVKELLENYKNDDWKQHVKKCDTTYNRELIYTSPEYDLVIITWCKNQGCAIHNHPENGCNVKILENSIKEKLYDSKNINII